MSTHPRYKLGRRPPKHAPALYLPLTGVVPVHPAGVDHLSQVPVWMLGRNTEFGTCGPTDAANYFVMVYRYLLGEDITVTDGAIFDLYRRSGNPHFDPTDPGGPGDQGVDMQTMLEALLAGGLDITHANGRVENVRPVAFAKLQAGIDDVRAAISIFGGANLGVDLEVSQQTQTDGGGPWDYSRSAEWGGHAVMAGRYTSSAVRGQTDVGVVTWAEPLGTTDTFLTHQLSEAWVVVLPVHLAHPAFQQGVDVAALASDFEALTGRPFPVQPTPPPVPPVPLPGVDPDVALAVTAREYVARHHAGLNRRMAYALDTWLAAKGLS